LCKFAETGPSIEKDLLNGDFRVHHGIIVLSLVHTVKALSAMLSAMLVISEAGEKAL